MGNNYLEDDPQRIWLEFHEFSSKLLSSASYVSSLCAYTLGWVLLSQALLDTWTLASGNTGYGYRRLVFARIKFLSNTTQFARQSGLCVVWATSREYWQRYLCCCHGQCLGVIFFRKYKVEIYFWEKQRILDESFISMHWKWHSKLSEKFSRKTEKFLLTNDTSYTTTTTTTTEYNYTTVLFSQKCASV